MKRDNEDDDDASVDAGAKFYWPHSLEWLGGMSQLSLTFKCPEYVLSIFIKYCFAFDFLFENF